MLTIHPRPYPLGDDHHTDRPFTQEDVELGNMLAYHMGDLFLDIDIHVTPALQWQHVVRALRIHGLKIVDSP